ETLSYDLLGNMTRNSDSFGGQTYAYGNSARPHGVAAIGTETFGYDSNGNMTSGRGREMGYDGSSRLKKVQMTNGRVVEYGYGGLGERLFKKVSGTGGDSSIYYFGNLMEVQDGLMVHHIYAGDKEIATIGEGTWAQPVAQAENNTPLAAGVIARPEGPRQSRFVFPLWQAEWDRMDRAVAWEMLCLGAIFIIVIVRRHPNLLPSFVRRGQGEVACAVIASVAKQSRFSPSYAVCFLLIFFLAVPTHSFAYVFPSDIEDNWPPADQSFFLYIHTDHLGSSNLLTEGQSKSTHNGIRFVAGEVVQRVEYMPFGKERYVLNPALKGAGPKFTGQTQDEEDGLYFYKSRYYDPVLGRFIQPDALVLASASNPQTLNSYSYVLNNPLKYTDPTGHFVDPPENSEADRDSIDASIAEIDRALGKLDKEIADLNGFLEGDGTAGDRFGFEYGNSVEENSFTGFVYDFIADGLISIGDELGKTGGVLGISKSLIETGLNIQMALNDKRLNLQDKESIAALEFQRGIISVVATINGALLGGLIAGVVTRDRRAIVAGALAGGTLLGVSTNRFEGYLIDLLRKDFYERNSVK
ncbi:MAG: RHS repeat-associated core domain-containing protein, partial [Deltaproteobacteria bacterium]|nr:RHS repeat-associated core domain-containing protein [Deltaproteobacteria bacterium]